MADQPALHVLFPANRAPDGYAERMALALEAQGRSLARHALPGDHPRLDPSAVLAADIALSRLPDGARVLVDGGALPGLAAALAMDNRRLRLVALVDRLLWLEPGLTEEEAAARRHLEQGALALMRAVAVPDAAAARAVADLGLAPEAAVVLPPDAAGAARLDSLWGT
ncbi:glycosyl transferase [Azospirillum sp. TSH58]|uniref:glycosyl transferase n=1 Tax=Azospirillum sp. TSH58 TaxID=664962 RepID=UPI000D6009CA|nr:glycosyl transferase [Azospirillum sp. TSH58]AWJ83988.1 glycosyl transferase [Azospirillum sp. TSH58]PWC70769.1 glycosyl transferase [Azospirillum sp. TSH58]